MTLRDPAAETAAERDAETAGPELARRVGHGALWAAASNVVIRLGNIAVTAVVARLLAPEEFGAFAVALAVFMVVTSLAELGMASAVARSRFDIDDIAPTVTTISWAVSVVLAVAMAIGAPGIASAVGVPEAAGAVRVLAISLVLTGFFAVPGAQLARDLGQDRLFLATVAGFVPANAVLLVLAQSGGGATAFAWSRVVGQVVTGAVMVALLQRRYRPGWQRHLVRPLVAFGLPLALANLVNWSLLNADYLIIGRLLDAAEVGVYMIAFSMASWTTAILGSMLNSVVVPAVSRVRDDPVQLPVYLVRSVRLVAIVALPVCAGSIAVSHTLVVAVFGQRWAAAGPVLQVLAVYGAVFAFSLLAVNVLVSLGATRSLLLVQVAWVVVLVPLLVVGIQVDGLRGAALAHVVAITTVGVPLYLGALRRSCAFDVSAAARSLLRPAVASAAAGGLAWALDRVVQSPWGSLGLAAAGAGALYLALLRRDVREVLGVLRPVGDQDEPAPRPTRPVGVDPASPVLAPEPDGSPISVVIGLEGLALGGCPINALDLAVRLRRRGHRVHVFAVDEEVPVSVVPYAEQVGVELELLPSDPSWAAQARRVAAIADRHEADVVHVFAPWLGPVATLAVSASRRRCSALVTNWTMDNVSWLPRRTPLLVGTREMQREAAVGHRAPVWFMPPPVDTDLDRPDDQAGDRFRHAWGLTADDVVLCIVSRVDRSMKLEGILCAIAAVELLDDARLRLVVVGDGDASEVVARSVAATNGRLGRRAVVTTGSLVDPRPAYAAADVVLGMGGSALRGLAHAKPLVVLGTGGFSLAHDETSRAHFDAQGFFGTHGPADPVRHLAEQVQQQLARRHDDLGPRGREQVVAHHGLDACTDQLVLRYRESLTLRPSPAVRALDASRLRWRERLRDARRAVRGAGRR